MNTIVLASDNPGKYIEFQAITNQCHFNLVAQKNYQVTPVEETASTFIENAIIKTRHACKVAQLPAIGDDSGLCVEALHGEPGIYSARYASDKKNPDENIDKLLEQLSTVAEHERNARFYCVIVYMRHSADPSPIICQGIWSGKILGSRQGTGGFGYDPVFYVPSHNCSAAELTLAEKNRISHRGKALQQLIEQLKNHEQ